MKNAIGAFAAAATLVIGAAAFAPAALAQCDSCGCPSSNGPKGADRIQPGQKKVKRTTGATTGGNSSAPTSMVQWNTAGSATWSTAQSEERPIVLYFSEWGSPEPVFDAAMVELSKKNALFVKVHSVDIELDPTEEAISALPKDKLSADNLWKAYGVDKAGTMVLCDWFGNDFETYKAIPAGKTLLGDVEDVSSDVEEIIEDLTKDLERAKETREKKGDVKALERVVDMFEDGHYGYAVVSEAIDLYNELIEAGRAKLEAAKDAGDEKAIKDLAKDYKGTEVEAAAVKAGEKADK